jgi:hypothetical protein
MNKIFKIIILSFLILFILIFGVFYVIKDDKDICLDSGICREGLIINTQYGEISINKENCIKYNWLWNDEKRFCKIELE